ncbi:methyl-accepting chemotaxis protein [Desulfosporosinus orientis DSM 765]|uniref:Methyl-accepting chemotaxis protein n=1 Tax=Desulfosporosinus orientis (strain ATCC 19365 / DSM 765 / NCIMB 8382 / VKM B-1628 / Singapore I) TaxID=768706 RepID=G7W997_DESOD|nr:methyl-accepting chemotaxis protein [Desulfosporosinus orientis]AET68738.1 methyl-accepting chemotaxis protein [Desulfosporosinus orientis DSM 765]
MKRLNLKWFTNWKTFYKINALVLVMVIFMLGLSYMGYYYYRQAKVAMNEVYDNSLMAVKLINEANANVRMIRSVNIELLLAPLDSAQKQNLLIQTSVLMGLINESLDNYTPLAKEPFEISKLAQVREDLKNYDTEWQQVILLMNQNDHAGAYSRYSMNITPIIDDINTLFPQLVEFSTQKAKSTIVRENLNFENAEIMLFGFPITAAVLASVLGALVARAMSKPLQKMLVSVRELAAGNLKVEQISLQSKDEIGQLAEAFNQMILSLAALISRVSVSSQEVNSSAHQLHAITKQGSIASGHIAAAVTEVAAGTEKQAASVSETVSAIEQINANIQMVAESSQRVTALTAKTALTTEEGQGSLTQAMEQMNNINTSTQTVKNAINMLADSSEQIAGIARSISGITDQTNLLALNAAIEAARAGEHGRGFSVVADEVRKLAEKAKAATAEITALVVVNQENIAHAVMAMNQEEAHVSTGIDAVNKVGYGLNDILISISEVSAQVATIAASIQQMAGGSHQIVAGVQEIGAVSQGTAEQAANAYSEIEEFTASIDEIYLSCQSLTNLAANLQAGISHFRI